MSEMRSIVNQLCQEFMSDIVRVTSSAEDDDDVSALQGYLLHDRGWMLLYAINRNGLQGLTVGKDFSNLLVSLLPWCLKFTVSKDSIDIEHEENLPSVNASFYHLQNSPKWVKFYKMREKVIPSPNKRSWPDKKISSGYSQKKRTKVQPLEQMQSSNSEDEWQETKLMPKSHRFKSSRRSSRIKSGSILDGAVERSMSTQEDEEEELESLLSKYSVKDRTFSTEKLCILILDLIQEICLQDLTQTVPTKVLSSMLLSHLLHVFTCLYPSSSKGKEELLAADWSKRNSIHFQRKLLRVVFVMSGIVSTQQNGVNIILGHKVLPVLLEVSRQLYQMEHLKEQLLVSKGKSPTDVTPMWEEFVLFSEIILGLLTCLDIIFQCLPFNLVVIKNAVQLMEEFDDSHGFEFLQNVIQCLDERPKAALVLSKLDIGISEPIKTMASFLNTAKSLKVNYIHNMKCMKKKHKKCQFSQYFDHHHNILGIPYNIEENTELSKSSAPIQNSTCLVTSWSLFLIDLLPVVKSKAIQIEVLKTLMYSGVCCCLKLDSIIQPILQSIPLFSTGVQSFALDCVNKIVLKPFGGSIEKPYAGTPKSGFKCLTCTDRSLQTTDEELQKTLTKHTVAKPGMDSGFSSHDFQSADVPEKVLTSKWSVLEEFRTLLFSKEPNVSEVTARYLFDLVIDASQELHEELFFRVYMFAFESFLGKFKQSSTTSLKEEQNSNWFSAKVKVHCLSALPHLLQVESVLKTFLNRRGIGQICSMLNEEKMRAPVLKVFEALVLLDDRKVKEIEQSIESSTDSRLGSSGMVIKAFVDGLMKKSNFENQSTTSELDQAHSTDYHLNIKDLALVVEMWETCAKICLRSEELVSFLESSQCIKVAENMLLSILKQVTSASICKYECRDMSDDSGQEQDPMVLLDTSKPTVCFLKLALLQALLVVCSSCYKHQGRQRDSRTWMKIMDYFHQCSRLPATKLKTVCDIILNSAMPKKTTALESSRNHTLYQMFIKDDNIEDEEVRQLLQLSSEDECDSILFMEKGYDGDLESQPDELNCKMTEVVQEREHFPSLFRLLFELLIKSHQTLEGKEIIPQQLCRLLQTLRTDHEATIVVCNEGLLLTLLEGFWSELTSEKACEQVCSYLLSLIQLLAQHRLTARELQLILQLFQYSHIPHENLLSTLLSVVENSSVKPYYSVRFPASPSIKKSPSSTATSTSPPTPKIALETNQSQTVAPALKTVLSGLVAMNVLNDPPKKKQNFFTQEVWSMSAVQIPMKKGFQWPRSGFSVALWIKLSDSMKFLGNRCRSRTGNCVYTSSSEDLRMKDSLHECKGNRLFAVTDHIHIVSVGNSDKMLEVWCSVQTGHLMIRLTSATREAGLVIKEVVTKETLSSSIWQHLVISYQEVFENMVDSASVKDKDVGLLGMVELTLDGWLSEELKLEQTVSSLRVDESEEEAVLCVGQVNREINSNTTPCTWSLGSLLMFKGSDITKEECFHLYSLGPNHTSLCKCDTADTEWIYSPLLTKSLVQHSKISMEVLTGEKIVDCDRLRFSLLLNYNPSSPDDVSYYDLALREEMPSLLAGNLGLPLPQNVLLSQFPMIDYVRLQASLETRISYGLEKAVREAGGIEALLFLVAKIIEGNQHEDDKNFRDQECLQAKAMQLLFSFVNHSPILTQDYLAANGNILLTKVLTSSRCTVGFHTLKVLMDAGTTESMFRFEPDSGTMVMRRKSEAMIKNVSVISDLLLNWRIWEGATEGVLDLLFKALASLIREDHPYQAFNIKQCHSAEIVNKLFCAYQERIQEGLPSFSIEISQSVVSIVQSMLGQPPDLHIIVAICDFLLFIHPATNSFINHDKKSFYFSLRTDNSPKLARRSSMIVHKVQKLVTSTPHSQSQTDGIEIEKTPSKELSKRSLTFPNSDKQRSREDSFPHLQPVDMEVEVGTEILPLSSPANEDSPVGTVFQEGQNFSLNSNSDTGTRSDLQDIGLEHVETVSDLEENEELDSRSIYKKSGSESEHIDVKVSSYSSTYSDGSHEEGIYAPKEEVYFDESIEDIETERGLIAVGVGLFHLLADVLVNMPDKMVQKVFMKVIKPDILIILAHNNSPQIRTAILKLLNNYLTRATEEHIEDFLKKESLYLLGAQLYQYPTYTEQMEEVLSVLVGHTFSFETTINLCLSSSTELSSLQQAAVPLLLAVTEKTIEDVSLCHNSITILQELFETVPMLGSLMLEHGLMEMICNMIIRVNHMSSRPTDVVGQDEHQICLLDIHNLVHVICSREFSASGTHHFQQFEEFLDLLKHVEMEESKIFGDQSKQVQNIKTFQCSTIISLLNYVENASQEEGVRITRQKSALPNLMEDVYGFRRETSTTHLSSSYPKHLINPTMQLTSSFTMVPTFKRISPISSHLSSDQPFDDDHMSGDSDSSNRSASALRLSNQPIARTLSMEHLQPKPVKSGFSITSMLSSLTRKKRLSVFPMSQSEMIDRFKKIIVCAVDVVVFSDKAEIQKTEEKKKVSLLFEKPLCQSTESTYSKRLFDFLYRAYELTLSQEKMVMPKQKNQVMWSVRDVTKFQLGRLMVFMLSGKQEFDDRTYILSYISNEIRGREILKLIINSSNEQASDLAFHMLDLMTTWKDSFNSQQWEDAHKILQIIKNTGVSIISPSKMTKDGFKKLQEDKRMLLSRMNRCKEQWNKKRIQHMEKILHKYDKLCQQLSSQAMDMTQSVVRLQTQERNKFIEHLKRSMTEKIQVKKMWQLIVQNLTHDRAVWHDPQSYPKSWQLDPTEGPGRVRKRLKRCHLGIQKRFLMEDHQDKLDHESKDPPLIYLFEDDHQTSDSAALIYKLYRNEKIQHTCRCTAVSPSVESKGELLVGENSIFFVADEAISDANYTQVLLGNKDQLSMTWPYEDVREVHKRWFQLRDIGIEIFLTSGKTCLLACQNKKERDFLFQHLLSLELPNFVRTVDLDVVQKCWIEGKVTNFDYLTYLNKIAGRTFNDLMQYPIFPFILKDYFSEKLDLQSLSSFRNLSKPMSVQDKSKEQKYMDNYNVLKREYEQHSSGDVSMLRVEPYHYGSHYSNSGTVLHFLVRLPPFTKMFLSYQDNNFDIPDRTFHSVQTSWRLASFESATDVKELIPEFFFLPEFLQNFEDFDFGKRQNGERVSHVNLPPWCRGDPRLFVLVLRQALESRHVSENLHQWIDLVFGFKQQGEAAVKALNVFHPSTYFGMDVDSVQDPVRRHALRTMIKTYGQTPKQLFRQPHPQRVHVVEGSTPSIISQIFSSTSNTAPIYREEKTPLSYVPSPLQEISGLRWGVYVGSRNLRPPEIVWQKQYSAVVADLVALPTGDVFGVGEKSCCLTMHSQQKVATVYNSTDVIWAAILDWKRGDGILCINNHKDRPVVNFLHHGVFEQITCCTSVPDCRLLFVGGTSGIITIYQTVYNQAKESHIQIKGGKKMLHGHRGQVNSLIVCKPYSVIVSGSEDKTCIIWDLNRLCLVQSITSHKSGVNVVAISPTLGDIASVSDEGLGSCLWLHTINAKPIASHLCQETKINCLAFSSAAEGLSVNVVAGGLDTGAIRLWSSWDLQVLQDLQVDHLLHRPVISLTFSQDSQRLYVSSSDGTVSMWESPPLGKHRQNNFMVYL